MKRYVYIKATERPYLEEEFICICCNYNDRYSVCLLLNFILCLYLDYIKTFVFVYIKLSSHSLIKFPDEMVFWGISFQSVSKCRANTTIFWDSFNPFPITSQMCASPMGGGGGSSKGPMTKRITERNHCGVSLPLITTKVSDY